MTKLGHNERSFRLDALAAEAREGLAKVEQGEEFTIGGWLAYGHALNEGRALFPGDREFGEWCRSSNLEEGVHPADRSAAMWAAANADQFEEARQRGNPRTIRGVHAKWKEIEAEREKAKRDEERKAKEESDQKEREARAETARKESADRARAEAEAKEAIEAASDEFEREQATARAEKAAAAAKEAAQKADDAVQAAEAPNDEPEPETTPDPYGYAKLTEEALFDLANGLRADLDEERAAHEVTKSDRDALKAQVKVLTSDEDSGRKIGTLMRQVDQAKGRSAEHQAKAAKLQRQVNAQAEEIKKLRREVEQQEVTL